MERIEKIKTYCSDCKKETNHEVLAQKDIEKKYTSNKKYWQTHKYHIVKCLGCDELSFLHVWWKTYSPSFKYHINYPEDIHQYGEFLTDDEQIDLPAQIGDLYDDLGIVFTQCSDVTKGVILRTIIEAVCQDKGLTGRESLAQKIILLKDKGYIREAEVANLNYIKNIGNDSVHRMSAAANEILDAALEATNYLLRMVYVGDKRTHALKGPSKGVS